MSPAEVAAWLESRCGKLTASRMADAMDFLRTGKESAARRAYKVELLAERMTGYSSPHYVTPAMQWGIDQEPAAKAAFECRTGAFLAPCGFVDHPQIDLFGATPDGLLDGAVVEFKCPTTTTHLEWLLAGDVPAKHKPQILAQLACTGLTRSVFVSYDPRVRREEKRLMIVEWAPQPEEIKKIENHAREFLAEVDAMFDQLNEAA